MGDYKKLRVWQMACEFADKVERLVEQLPSPVRARAMNQLVPAAHAIHENIAEGCGFDSDAQLAKYLRQALATANESEDELLALNRRQLLTGDNTSLLQDVRRICAILAVFRRRVDDSLGRQGRRPSRPPEVSRPPEAETASRTPALGAKSEEPSD